MDLLEEIVLSEQIITTCMVLSRVGEESGRYQISRGRTGDDMRPLGGRVQRRGEENPQRQPRHPGFWLQS